jgi:hypothetical protein
MRKKFLILSEDEKSETDKHHPLRIILESNNINPEEVKILAYNGCTQQRSVILLSTFMEKYHPSIRVIIHRDRDFMTDKEVDDIVRAEYRNLKNTSLFITNGSDIESHLINTD